MKTNPIDRALELRKTLISENGTKVLVADFSNTLQGKDTSKVIDLMPIVGTEHYPFRTKVNVKHIDPLAAKEYNVPYFDMTIKTENEIEEFIRKGEFDFPLWFKHNKHFKMKEASFYNAPFILQIAGCNFHDGSAKGGCWYCFVDDTSNDGILSSGKTYLTAKETIDSMVAAKEKVKKQYAEAGYINDLKVLRTSGGEPTIALDWILNLWREVEKRGLDFVGQIDSNLSTARLVDDFENKGIYEKNTLEKLAKYPIKILTAIKGCDAQNIQNNVQSETTLSDQEYSLRRFMKAGFDIYPQMYNPNPETLKGYLKKMDNIIENFSLRIHIGPLKVYGPTKQRLTLEANRLEVDSQEYIKTKTQEWDTNYKQGVEIINSYLRERYSVDYKQLTRSDVILKLL